MFNLGLPPKGESDAWLDVHITDGNFGFIIDFHTFLEHIHHTITGGDSLQQLHSVYKLKLSTISDLLAVIFFKVSTPHFMSSSGAHLVIYNEAS